MDGTGCVACSCGDDDGTTPSGGGGVGASGGAGSGGTSAGGTSSGGVAGTATGGAGAGGTSSGGSAGTSTGGAGAGGTSDGGGSGGTGGSAEAGDAAGGTEAGTDAAGDASNDAPADASSLSCFLGGTTATPSGAGTCASPWVITLGTVPHGTIASHTATDTGNAANISGGSNCKAPPSGTARDLVYQVLLPADTKGIEVSVDASSGANPRVAVLEDPSCGQPANACADAGGPGACEVLFAPRSGLGFFGTSTFIVVSELVSSGAALTMRVRSVGP